MKRKLNTSDGEVKPHCFFKLMISPTSFSKLRIPEKFTREFQDEICAACTLTVPTGETKQVAVVEEDNKLWFQDGWREFVEDFSVGYGYFLLFSYVGNSTFRVQVFDLTACEICYQSNACRGSPAEHDFYHADLNSGSFSKELCKDGDDDSESLVNVDSPATKPNNSDIEVALIVSEDGEMKSQVGSKLVSHTKQEIKDTSLGCPSWLKNCPLTTKRTSRITNAIAKVVAAAKITIPKRPYFISFINSSNLTHWLLVPAVFAQKHMIKCKKGDWVTIETSDGRQWPIQCHIIKTFYLGKGWTFFAREIGLEAGDVCVFELSDPDKYVLKVQVAKKFQKKDADLKLKVYCKSTRPNIEATPVGCLRWSRIIYDRMVKALVAAKITLPEGPFFLVLIKSSDLVHRTLSVPWHFAQEHLVRCKKGDLMTIETSDGRQWVIQYYQHKRHFLLGRGWGVFAREIGLEVGDICIYKLSDGENYVLKVQVVKKFKVPNLMTLCKGGRSYTHSTPLGCRRWSKISYDRVVKAVAAAGIAIPETPFFVALIGSSSVQRSALHVPLGFSREHLKCKTGDLIMIETSDGRHWVVQCCRAKKYCLLGSGWIIFAQENGLEAGDVCLFKLLDAEKYVLKVLVAKRYQIQDADLAFFCSSCKELCSGGADFTDPSDRASPVSLQCSPSEIGNPNSSDIEVILSDNEDDEIKSQEKSKHISKTKEENEDSPLGRHKRLRINYDGVVKAVADAGIATPRNPFFVSLITSNYLRKLRLPLAFVKEHLSSKKRYFIKMETFDERQWVILCNRSEKNFCVGKGWPMFRREIGLEVGDICVFELRNAGKHVLKVQVIKKSQIKDDANLLV